MPGAVWFGDVAIPGIFIVGGGKALVGIGAICPWPVTRSEVTAQAVLGVLSDTEAHIKPQGCVRKRAIDNTSIALTATATETEVIGAPDTGILDRAGIRIPLFVPVGLCSGVVALLLQKDFVEAHVVPVPRKKLPNAVDVIGLQHVHPLDLVPEILGPFNVELGWARHQAFFSEEVLGLLISTKSVPAYVMDLSAHLLVKRNSGR